ncbi:MAG TPA: hypothetical protein VLI90_00685, partial [Tepidisphaeraceae bacterium]|nr:hypothetical protein [Tepidisphaeraceae bacterium]
MRSRSFRGVHRPPFTRRHLVEPLESRTLLTTAALTGTSGNDVFEIAADWSAGTYQFWCGNTLQAEVPKSQGIAFTVVGNGGHDELDVDPQVSVTLTNDPGADGTKLDLRLFGYADFHDAAQLAQFQSIYPAGKGTSFTIDPDGTRLVEADSLTIDQFANGALMGRINLNDNAMIIHNPDATTAAAVQANIQAFVANSVNGGYANGA